MRSQICFYLMSRSQRSGVIPPQSQPPVSRVTEDANLPAKLEVVIKKIKIITAGTEKFQIITDFSCNHLQMRNGRRFDVIAKKFRFFTHE